MPSENLPMFEWNQETIASMQSSDFEGAKHELNQGLERLKGMLRAGQAENARYADEGQDLDELFPGPTIFASLTPLPHNTRSAAFVMCTKAFTAVPQVLPASRNHVNDENARIAGTKSPKTDKLAEATMWSCVTSYNLGLCHHLRAMSSSGNTSDDLDAGMLAYRHTLSLIYPWQEEPSYMLLYLAALNNDCHIQFQRLGRGEFQQESPEGNPQCPRTQGSNQQQSSMVDDTPGSTLEQIGILLSRMKRVLEDIQTIDNEITPDPSYRQEVAFFRQNLTAALGFG
uniref:Uncharacterized protein n=1 Tax=Entomoneis paludosa TaxID=265537 RepID=A0A6U3A7Q9_9STRA|mmetsp:Transcript_23514/g.48821  ORF Transcript_23514/g.48821 Transcript_23514/m.48821 type:complete len:285 (+) Transcript_23514:173-1027(+)